MEEQEFAGSKTAAAGLDYDESVFMDSEERREVLEEAGVDPDEFDFQKRILVM